MMNLAKTGMLRGAGKKGDIPPRKKRCPQTVQQYVKPTVPLSPSSSASHTSGISNTSSYHITCQTATATSNSYIMNHQPVNLSSPQVLNSPIIAQNPSFSNVYFPPRYPIQSMQFPSFVQNCNPFMLMVIFEYASLAAQAYVKWMVLFPFHLMIYASQDLKDDLTGMKQADHGVLQLENLMHIIVLKCLASKQVAQVSLLHLW